MIVPTGSRAKAKHLTLVDANAPLNLLDLFHFVRTQVIGLVSWIRSELLANTKKFLIRSARQHIISTALYEVTGKLSPTNKVKVDSLRARIGKG